MDRSNPISWQASLTPHRSLSRRAFVTLMGLIAAVNLVVGISFVAIGAWPVAGFAGLEVLLIWWAFRINFADGEREETIHVTDHEVIFERLSRRKEPETRRLVRRWVRVELAEDTERELIGRLHLVAGRDRIPVGDFLSPDERKTLASALRQALAIPRI